MADVRWEQLLQRLQRLPAEKLRFVEDLLTHLEGGDSSLLLGTPPLEPGAPESPINFVCADAAEFLEGCMPACFDSFALSNIGDGAPSGYLRRLRAAIQHAAAPGAVVVSRSFAEPSDDTITNWAAQDRSLLWGVIKVNRIEGGKPCSIC